MKIVMLYFQELNEHLRSLRILPEVVGRVIKVITTSRNLRVIMRIFVLTATYELSISRKSHLRDHPSCGTRNLVNVFFFFFRNLSKELFFDKELSKTQSPNF
jgi:hypothetical protein